MSEQETEKQIQAKGLTAPRVRPEDLDAEIASEHYFTAADGVYMGGNPAEKSPPIPPPQLDLLTFCVLVLRNGFTVTGESACASLENFDPEIGRKIARENARQKLWPLLGFRLRDHLALPAPEPERRPQHIKPTVGRKLWLWHGTSAGDFNVIDGQPLDATITHVKNDRRISVWVLDHLGIAHSLTDVFLRQDGDAEVAEMHAAWMPYQVGQARKA